MGFKEIATAQQLFRKSDPSSSRLAAEHMVSTGKHGEQIAHVLELVRKHPDCTAFELIDYSTLKLDRYQIQRRLSDLADTSEGKVAKVSASALPRRCSKSGRMACTWRVV